MMKYIIAAVFLTVPQHSLISGLSTVGRVAFDFSIRASSQLDEEVIVPPAAAAAEEEYDEAEQLPPSDEFDPICRVVASSDNKLPPTIVSKLSQSSSALLKKIDLLYTAQSKKELRDLAYLQPVSSKDTTPYNSMEEVVDDESEITKSKAYDMNQEEKLISILKRSLDDGGYKLMDQKDLDLCSALNAGYLLRLSLLPDLKNLESVGEEFYPSEETITNGDSDGMKQLILDGKVLIFRRGYTNEITKGRLLLPKLDYLQTSLVQKSTRSITMKLGGVERRLEEFTSEIVSQVNDYVQNINRRLMKACSELMYDILDSVGLSNNTLVAKIMLSNNATADTLVDNYTQSGSDSSSRNMASSSATTTTARGNRIFKLNRYDVGSSFDISDATISSFIMCEKGNETTSVERDIYDAIDAGTIDSASIYKKSAVRLLERISIDNTVDFLSKKGRRTLLRNYFKSSTLLEPSYEEVVVIWRPAKKKLKRIKTPKPPRWLRECVKIFGIEERVPLLKNVTSQDDEDDETMLPLEIKAFNDVPMANILAVLPKNKLIFRPADAFVFDFVSLATFLATAASFKFDSPKLDLLALVSVVLFAVRTFFRYSNKYARYDLLVNKFLTSKLSHRGQGALNYLAQEASSQKALRAMCVRDWLSRSEERDGVISLTEGEAYINEEAFSGKSRINVDILSGIDDLKDLGQLTSTNTLVNDDEAEAEIKRIWEETLQD